MTWNFHWQVIVTSAGSMAFEEMSQSMEKLLASADEKLQAAGIREVGQRMFHGSHSELPVTRCI